MKRISFWAFFCALILAVPSFGQETAYTHHIAAGAMTFHWSVDGDSLHIKLSAKTTGWVGIGFNPEKEMKGANIIIGYVKDGKAYVRDDFGITEKKHAEDTKAGGKSDITGISGTEANGTTEIAFTVPLNSGDVGDTALNAEGETTVLLAHGAGRDSFLSKHVFRAVVKVNLSTGAHSVK